MRIHPSILLLVASIWAGPAAAQEGAPDRERRRPFHDRPDLAGLSAAGMRDVVERYSTDLSTLRRFFDVARSEERRRQERSFFDAWSTALAALDFAALGLDDRIDCLLLENRLRYELRRLDLADQRAAETAPLVPFAETIAGLQIGRRMLEPLDPARAAARLDELCDAIEELRGRVQADDDGTRSEEPEESDPGEAAAEDAVLVSRLMANRAAGEVRSLRRSLDSWFEYHDGYDPLFSWWVAEPHERLGRALDEYATFLREEVAGVAEDDTDTILGDPIGRDALLVELEREMIPYTPEQLMAIARAELAWCDEEMALAAADLGFGTDWRAAQEHVKTLHVGPGEQPELVRTLAWEAVDFLEEHELLTLPTLAKTSWRMEMMSPERQQYTPYFTGGEVISVAFPTDSMEHGDKLMSMRGNNIHFSRATVHHELIPGHHLQQFMTRRHRPYRRIFGTPFWGEGWALYWEMLLWNLDFPRSAEDRVGMLFWRKHRCARILFSLGFHLGELTPEECIDLLVDRVGHERRNATAEVRRSVQGGYGPLYQAAYMLGGLQFLALHTELVGGGRMTDRAFHDAILRENSIPVEMVRAKLLELPLTRDFRAGWEFYGEVEVK